MSRLAALVLAAAAAKAPPFKAVLPAAATATWLVRFDDGARATPAALGVGLDGTAWLGSKDTFVPLASSVAPFRLAVPADGFAFGAGGVLAVVSAHQLGVVGAKGFTPVADLPRAGFKVTSGGRDSFLLWQGRDLYRFRAGAKVEHVLASPEPIDAVAGDDERTLVSAGGAVVSLSPEPQRVLLTADSVLSLALAPDGAFFYATASEIGWSGGGKRAPFIQAPDGAVVRRGDTLFVHLRKQGVVALEPVSAFAVFGRGKTK
jgi:hypothetical protein